MAESESMPTLPGAKKPAPFKDAVDAEKDQMKKLPYADLPKGVDPTPFKIGPVSK